MLPSIKYQLIFLTSIFLTLTNVFFPIIGRPFGWTETDNFLLSILILIPDAGPFIWFVITTTIGIKLARPKSRPTASWTRRQLQDRKALASSITISSLIFAWDSLCFGLSLQKYFLNPGPQFQWNPRSPKMSLIFFLWRCAMVLFLGLVFYGIAFMVFSHHVQKWKCYTQVEEFNNDVIHLKSEDKSCVETTWEERLGARLAECEEKGLQERLELGERRKSF